MLRLLKCLEINLFFYIGSVAYGQMFVMVPILSDISKYFSFRDKRVRIKTVWNGRFFTKNR